MPIYLWKCQTCNAVVEELRKMGDYTPPESCGGCKEDCECGNFCDFKKQLTAANFTIDPAAGHSKGYKAPEEEKKKKKKAPKDESNP